MSQDPFSQYMRQLQQRAAGGRPGGMPGGRGLFAGSGLLISLVAGGFALNASLFNGAWYRTNSFRFVSFKSVLCSVDGGHRAIKYTRSV